MTVKPFLSKDLQGSWAQGGNLTSNQIAFFHLHGFLIFEGFLDAAHCRRLQHAVDQMGEEPAMFVKQEALGLLTSHPATMTFLESLMGTGFAMHHIHAICYGEGAEGKPWHHDYRQIPQTNRSHLMVHCLYYASGLNGEVGDLLLLPGSHQTVLDSKSWMALFGYQDLPGSLTISSLMPGTMILLHSALLHARRPKPGGAGIGRYFIDISYCQEGVKWPGHEYGGGYQKVNRYARDHGYDRDGRYAHLYNSDLFFDASKAQRQLAAVNRGSLAPHLPKLED